MIKRHIILAALAGLVLSAGAAQAATVGVTGTVTVTGNVAGRCDLSISSAAINIPELSNTSTGQLDPTTVSSAPHVNLVGFCNGAASTMQIVASPLLNAGTPPVGFTNRVDYTATATENAIPATDNTIAPGSDHAPVIVGNFSGNIDVGLSNATSPVGSLLAGPYTASVIVTLTAA
jgi:type 1 fimbria pilin